MTMPAGQTPGWQPDAADPSHARYWDGTHFAAEMHFDGSQWVQWQRASDGRFYPPAPQPSAWTVPPTQEVTHQAFSVATALPDAWFGHAQDHVSNSSGRFGANVGQDRRWTAKTIVGSLVVVLLVGIAIGIVSNNVLSGSGPKSTASAVVSDLQSGSFSQVCTLALPTQVSKCDSDLWPLAAHHVTYQNLAVGTVTDNEDRALLVMTGSVCLGPTQCFENQDPNAALDSGKTFDEQYALAVSPSPSNPMFVPFVEQDGKWYVTGF